jgi:hypothetical protein
MHAQVIVSTACKTAGEALREIDIKDIIKGDFVLVSGDVVSNMDLGAALEDHKARRDKDKNALMTMVKHCLLTPSGHSICHPKEVFFSSTLAMWRHIHTGGLAGPLALLCIICMSA